jgi:hypothetical protein
VKTSPLRPGQPGSQPPVKSADCLPCFSAVSTFSCNERLVACPSSRQQRSFPNALPFKFLPIVLL